MNPQLWLLTSSPWAPWALFGSLVLALLTLERVVLGRNAGPLGAMPLRATLLMTSMCIACAGLFGAALLWLGGPDGAARATAFGTVYTVEFALSVDNLFIFLLIFNSFRVSGQQAHRVLTWGIGGAVLLRGLFIVLGASLFARFDWLFYPVGLFLVATGVKLFIKGDDDHGDAHDSWAIRMATKMLPMAQPRTVDAATAGSFFVRENGRLKTTPLFLVLVAVEASDVLFALDSVPASFAITQTTEVIFFANMFAVLGLRCLYALLAHAAAALRYLNVALAIILVLIGLKMLLRHVYEVPDVWFLATVLSILAASTAASAIAGPAKTSG